MMIRETVAWARPQPQQTSLEEAQDARMDKAP